MKRGILPAVGYHFDESRVTMGAITGLVPALAWISLSSFLRH